LEADKIESLSIAECSRSLAYIPPPDSKHGLWLQSEMGGHPLCIPVSVLEGDHKSNQQVGSEFYVFIITQTDGKEHILRGMKIDRILKWINMLSLVSVYIKYCLQKNYVDNFSMNSGWRLSI
jgi:hypothetical protein